MLSKTEKEYMLGNYVPTKNHKRVLDHRINKKLIDFFRLELPLIQNSVVTDFRNITKFSNTKLIAEGTRSPFSEGKRSLGCASTTRPNAYEAFALPG